MTIQFSCPFCMAAIEVPQSAAGKMGRCPVCAAKLSVPGMSPGTAAPAATQPPLSTDESESPADTAAPPAFPFGGEQGTPASEALPVTPGMLPDPTRPTSARNSVARRVKRRARRRGRWGIPLLFGGAFAGFLIWWFVSQIDWTPLSGKITATTYDYLDAEAFPLSCEGSAIPKRLVSGILETLQGTPVLLTGDLVQAQIRGEGNDLLLSVRPGKKSKWYQVDFTQHAGIQRFLAQNAQALEARRRQEVSRVRDEFLTTADRVQNGPETSMAYTPFRDSLVLPAVVQALGHQVVAKVGNNLFPCVREPQEGRLLFLLPTGVTQFEVIGRQQADGSQSFPGHFNVTVIEPPPAAKELQPGTTEIPSNETEPTDPASETMPAPAAIEGTTSQNPASN